MPTASPFLDNLPLFSLEDECVAVTSTTFVCPLLFEVSKTKLPSLLLSGTLS